MGLPRLVARQRHYVARSPFGLHPLKGKPAGRYAVSVDENYRVIFRFEAGHAVEVDYGDYH